MAAKKKNVPDDPVARGLDDIKRLLMLMLSRGGATQAEIAKALGVNQSSISRMFPGASGKSTKPSAP